MIIQILFLSLLFAQAFCRADSCSPLDPKCKSRLMTLREMKKRTGLSAGDNMDYRAVYKEDLREGGLSGNDIFNGSHRKSHTGGAKQVHTKHLYFDPATGQPVNLELTEGQTDRLNAFITKLYVENQKSQRFPTIA
ncbi:uncharacterized protein LOC117169419 [Belonocnema kinseyi]|uniref:uncharacterized protein LOC117169419 n=1 Tax=Belonocnema kinseyi TaxID=2817044 RepID=UPI00143DAED3|nr:uncharacterized protein LOC117169419 [Belonocnema kinseyi]